MRRLDFLAATLALLFTGSLALGSPASYDFVTVDFPGANLTQFFGLNDRGDFVGRYSFDGGVTNHGFLYRSRDGSFTTIDYPGAAKTSPHGVDDSGEISGNWTDSAGGTHGFALLRGVFRSFDLPGAVHTAPFGQNSSDDIVGSFDFGDVNTAIGFLLHRGRFTSFEVPGSFPQSTIAGGINDGEQIVGSFGDLVDPDNIAHGFLLDHGQFTQIDFPGDDSVTLPWGINNKGSVVGFCFCIDGTSHGFVMSSGGFAVVDYPVANSRTQVRQINSSGQIVGSYLQHGDPSGVVHAFIGTPTH